MPRWDIDYLNSLRTRFSAIHTGLSDRIEAVVRGRVAPAPEAIPIGSGRAVRAAVMFFDIRHFTTMTGSAEPEDLKRTLVMLDCVIPVVMHVVHDVEGYVEKNTGDGVMAVIGVDKTDAEAANAGLDAATTIFYVLQNVVNPALEAMGIVGIQARIGIDLGNILLARVGVATGSARFDRNFITAVGPAANLASKLQGMAGTDQIWVGDNIARNAAEWRRPFFVEVTPMDWTWTWNRPWEHIRYSVWHYAAEKKPIVDLGSIRRLLRLDSP
jgi:adenylate cyclase